MKTISAEKFDSMVAASYNKVKDYVRGLCQNAQEAEDITQEAFVRAYRFFHTFDGRASFDTWVMTIARNQHHDSIRRAKCRVKPVALDVDRFDSLIEQLPDSDLSPEAVAIRSEQDPDLVAAINELDETQRQILKWIAVEEVTYSEVASKLDIPIGTVKSRYSRLIKVARRKYQETFLTRQLAVK